MDSRIKELFERYETGKVSAAERKLVEDWFASFDKQQNVDLSDEQMAKIFWPVDKKVKHITRPRKILVLNRVLLKIAAVLILTLSIGFIWNTLFRAKPLPVKYSYLTAPLGAKKEFSLADGTVIFLNSGSMVRVPSDFGKKQRAVLLSGEAFFVVKHNPEKPFSIIADDVTIRDLGTSFDVKAYKEDKKISISVETGEVMAQRQSNDKKKLITQRSITHNQQWVYDDVSGIYALREVQSNRFSAWKDNRIQFDNASFEEIAATIQRWYNIPVTLSNNRSCRRYTVSFKNEPIQNVLYVLQSMSGMEYKILNKHLFINLKNCKKT